MKYDNIFKIQLIREKYKNNDIPEKGALKIFELEQSRNKLKIFVPLIDAVTILDLFITDPIPYIDEILLILSTIILNICLHKINKGIKELIKTKKRKK